MTYVYASTAKQTYKLSERDLGDLQCRYLRNPHYASAAPMRLYDEEEVRVMSEEKAYRLQYEREHAEEIKARKYEESKREARELTARCRDTIGSWSSSDRGRIEKYSSRIPFDVLSSILVRLCDDI